MSTALLTARLVRDIRVHPMHHLFVTAGFFAFHLLLAYLVDVISVNLAFAISAASSVLLVFTYLQAALRGAVRELENQRTKSSTAPARRAETDVGCGERHYSSELLRLFRSGTSAKA